MVALRMNQQATKTTLVVKRSRSRLLSGHGYAHDTLIPKDYGLSTWRVLRVLIVDHQQDRADRLSARIEDWGRAAQVAHSGQAALILAADGHPDVVLPATADVLQCATRVRHFRLPGEQLDSVGARLQFVSAGVRGADTHFDS